MRTKIFPRVITIILFLSLIVIIPNCTNDKNTSEIKIGAILPLTGSLSFMGELERTGMELALSDLNNNKVKVFFEDSKGAAKDGINAAQKLINIEKVNCLITSGTAASRSISSLHESNKFIQSAFCMDPTIQDENRFILRLYYGMEQEAETILNYFGGLNEKNTPDLKNGVDILSVNHQGTVQQTNDYLIPGLNKLGIEIKSIETYEFSQKDFKNIIAKIKSDNVKYLILIGYGFVYPELFKNFEEAKILGNLNIVGGWGFIAKKNLSDSQLENVVVATPTCMVNKNEEYLQFEKQYLSKFNKEPNFESALAYENIMLLNSAMSKIEDNFDAEVILQQLLNTKHQTLLGEISIDESGKLQIPMSLAVFKGGKLTEVGR